MKKNLIISGIMLLSSLLSCKKESSERITLTASTTAAAVGQNVSFQVISNASAVKWSVSPEIAVSKLYSITNAKSNQITFSQPGQYTVGVSVRDMDIDSVHEHNQDSCWHSHDHEHGHCSKGIDSASVVITVK